MEYVIKFFILIIISMCIAVLFNASRKHFFKTAFVGALSAMIYQITVPEVGEIVAIAIASFSMAMVSQVLSRLTQSPAQGFIITGAIFLVPGMKVLNMMIQIRDGNTINAIENIYGIVSVLGTISFSLMMAAAIIPTNRDL